MDRLSLVLDLRKALWDISQTGGDTSLYVPRNHSRLNELRKCIFDLCKGQEIPHDNNRYTRRHLSLADLLERDNFERYISYCAIRLRDFGVPEEDHQELLKSTLARVVPEILSDREYPEQELSDAGSQELAKSISFEDMVTAKLVECFRPWYYPTIILAYEILEEHMLAIWNFESTRWQPTNLGRYALRLNAFSLLTFLLSIELSFTRNFRSCRYPNERILAQLLNKEETRERRHSRDRNPIALRWYGILDFIHGRSELTGFGRQLLGRVLENKEQMKDLILMLVETNDKGLEVTEDDSIIQKSFELSRKSKLLASFQKISIRQISADYDSGDYLGSLTRFYPLIEGFIDAELRRRGLQINARSGMSSKLAELVRCQAITHKLGSWGEIVNSRNKIVHGNLMDDDQDVLKPLLAIVASFWHQLLSEVTTTTPLMSVDNA